MDLSQNYSHGSTAWPWRRWRGCVCARCAGLATLDGAGKCNRPTGSVLPARFCRSGEPLSSDSHRSTEQINLHAADPLRQRFQLL
jgi:hypothetical protein